MLLGLLLLQYFRLIIPHKIKHRVNREGGRENKKEEVLLATQHLGRDGEKDGRKNERREGGGVSPSLGMKGRREGGKVSTHRALLVLSYPRLIIM